MRTQNQLSARLSHELGRSLSHSSMGGTPDGSIDWDRHVRFNSGAEKPLRLKTATEQAGMLVIQELPLTEDDLSVDTETSDLS